LKRKKRAWKDLNINIITPSHWLAECVQSSSLFKNCRVKVIPHGLDIQRFKPIDKLIARDILSMPHDKKIILFGALNSTSDKRKGFQLLISALKILNNMGWQNKIELIIFGSSKPHDAPDIGCKTSYVGHLNDDLSLSLVYNSGDVVVIPSTQEAFGQTAIESISCGTPVVAFNVGGLPDIIEHRHTGYLAKPFDPEDLAKGIEWIIEDEKRWNVLSQQARQKVEKEFKLEIMAEKYLDLYNEVLENSSNRNS